MVLYPLFQRYLVLYIDANYVPIHRNRNVILESYYSILGILHNGRPEVLSVVHHPEEEAFSDKTSQPPTLHQHALPMRAYVSPALFVHFLAILRHLLYKMNTPSRNIRTFPRFFSLSPHILPYTYRDTSI